MKRTMLLFLLLTIISSAFASSPYWPHKIKSDYQEDYRPQFHFSPMTGWMNDINALVYQGGVFSYSEQFAFDPKSRKVEIRVDGEVKVKSLKLHEIKSIWKK